MDLHLCVPTLNRYDLLVRMIESAFAGSLIPAQVYILDNGQKLTDSGLLSVINPAFRRRLNVTVPDTPQGLARAWNLFLAAVGEERLIVNDDLVFGPESLKTIATTPGAFVSALAGSNAFSCFLIRDACLKRVGKFDETISPGYAYFEDNDYAERMALAGIPITSVDAGVEHLHSQTMAAYTDEELEAHHRKFEVAKANYLKKWGRLPGAPK